MRKHDCKTYLKKFGWVLFAAIFFNMVSVPRFESVMAADRMQAAQEAVSETTEADFTIEDGVLKKYMGDAKRVIIPDGVTEIAKAAFYSDGNMEYLYMPDSVTTIRDQAFRFCDALKEIRFSENLTEMEFSAFEGCYALQQVNLPDSLTYLPQYAFQYCSKVQAMKLPADLVEIDAYALTGMTELKAIEMPDTLMSVHSNAFDSVSATLIVSEGSVSERFAVQSGMEYVHKGTATLRIEQNGMGNIQIFDGEKTLVSGDTVRIGQLVYITAAGESDDLQVLANGRDLVYFSSANPFKSENGLEQYPYVIAGDTLLKVSFVDKAETINEALNVLGGSFDFAYSDVESVTFQGRRMAKFQKGSAKLSLTVDHTADEYISFDIVNNYWADHVYFKIDDTIIQIPIENAPAPMAYKIPAGKHVLTWYTEVNPNNLAWGITDVPVYIGNVFFTSDVNMLTATDISVSQKVIDLKIGETDTVTYAVEPELLSVKSVTWSGTNPDVVSVDAAGCVTGLARGKSVVKVELDGHTAVVPVYVSKYTRKGEYEYDGNVLMGYFGNQAVLELPGDVQAIGEYAFAGHTELEEITIPKTVTSIGAYAFDGCMGLEAIHIPSGVTEIDKRAFPKDAVLFCEEDSVAYNYALTNNLHYELPDGTRGVGETVETEAPIVNEAEITAHTAEINSREIYVPNDAENTYVCDGKSIYRYHISGNRFEEEPIVTLSDTSYTTAVRGSVIYIRTMGETTVTSHIIGYDVMKDKIVYEQDFPIGVYGNFAVDDEQNFFFTDNGIDLYIYDREGNKTSEDVTSDAPLKSGFGQHQISQVDPYNRVLLSTYKNTMGRAVHYEEEYSFSDMGSAIGFTSATRHFIGYKAYRNGQFISTSNYIKNPEAVGYSEWSFFDKGAYAVNAAGQIAQYKKVQNRTPGVDYDVLYEISDVDVYGGKRLASCKAGDVVYVANDVGKIYAYNVQSQKMEGLYLLPDADVQALYAVEESIYVRYTRGEKEYIANLQSSTYNKSETILRNQHITMTYGKEEVASRYVQCVGDVDYTKEENIFKSLPSSTAPYAAGELSQKVKEATLANLNYARWQSGLNEVSIYEDYMERSQKGAVLMAANRSLTHSPSQPQDMEDEFYQEGCAGVGADMTYSGNISRGDTLPESVFGYLDDVNNIGGGIGHRLSLLDKTADRTSFGYCRSYNAMSMYYADNPESLGNDEDFYAWPSAGYFPAEAVSSHASWHIITGFYRASNPQVDLAYDGKAYTVDKKALYYNKSYNAWYFDLPNELLAELKKNNDEFKDGVEVGVRLTGLYDKDGNPIEVSYPVRFVDAIPDKDDELGNTGGSENDKPNNAGDGSENDKSDNIGGGNEDDKSENTGSSKAEQRIVGTKTYKKAYGDKSFTLDIRLKKGNGTLSYSSSNPKVVSINKKGKVRLRSVGICTITVTARETVDYAKKTFTVKIQVNPGKPTLHTPKTKKGRKLSVSWKKDANATGYEVWCSTDKNFKKGCKKTVIRKNKTVSYKFTGLKAGKRYYVRIRSYKRVKVNGKMLTLRSKWSIKQSKKIRK